VNQDVQLLVQRPSGQRRHRRPFGRPLLIVQVALAVVLVAGAIVASRAFLSVLRVPLGFSPDGVATARVWPRGVRGVQLQDFYTRALESLSTHGDVTAAGAVGSMPLDGTAFDQAITVAGTRERLAGIVHVLPGYFETVGIPLLRGRTIGWDDVRSGADVAIASEGAARVLFPNGDPIGGTVSTERGRYTIVGVVANARKTLGSESSHPVYVIPREHTRVMTLVVRSRSRSDATLAAFKRELGALAPGMPVAAAWWSDALSGITAYRNPRFQTVVLGSFAGLALLLTATGIFGVVAFIAAARTKEMGIRIAIGARPASLVAMMLRQTSIPVAIGIAGGLVASRWMSRLAEAQLFQVDARDPIMLAAAAATVIATALAAAYLPARRASQVDPIEVLRAE
jgi:putative ABC transport system permease protein